MYRISLEDAYERWAGELVRYAAVLVPPVDAADIVAETFAGLIAQPAERWAAAEAPRQYLFGAVANVARMHHRSTSRRRRRHERATSHPTAAAELVLEHPAIEQALSSLSQQQREIVYLAYWEDLALPDIAAALNVSQGTIRKQLDRARARLRKVLS